MLCSTSHRFLYVDGGDRVTFHSGMGEDVVVNCGSQKVMISRQVNSPVPGKSGVLIRAHLHHC